LDKILLQIAAELNVRPAQVRAAVALLDAGSTVPFIARYRKEATDNLDDVQLRELEARLGYLRELEERRTAVLLSVSQQGLLTPSLQAALLGATTKQDLEDLYLPFRPKRRTKAMIAREAGLAPLADALAADPSMDPVDQARAYLNEPAGFADAASVLDGVRDILSERWAEDAELVRTLREWLWSEAQLRSQRVADKDPLHPEHAKFRDYYDYAEPLSQVPSHRALAVFRGRALGLLDVRLELASPDPAVSADAHASMLAEGRIHRHLRWQHAGRAGDDLLRRCMAWAWKVKLSLSLERDLFARLRESAEQVAIQVFAKNVRDLLLAAPAGPRVVLGLDPGIRTGCKVAVVDATGKVLATDTVYPHEPRRDWEGALHVLARLCRTHDVTLLAIGNGTASRETDQLAAELLQRLRDAGAGAGVQKVMVSEAGASVYSASEYASQELPELDVSLRGAVSIARRLQDPLAELVKIDPKSIGVGQYQHDVNQSALAKTLTGVIEDCVNAVGVDLNTASAPLLARVSGLSTGVAGAVVRWRDAHGAFRNRRQLLDVTGLGAKTFEQSAGFLRIRDGDNPLDQSGVHPETYPLVERLLAALGKPVAEVLGQAQEIRRLQAAAFVDERFGLITVQDVLSELEKPARDPRPDFKVARLHAGVRALSDLQMGMRLEGTVSNVAQFGAFVDLGVHHDGLIHVSQLARQFVKDARDVVKAGDIVQVRVLEVDAARGRISLTMKLDVAPPLPVAAGTAGRGTVQTGARGAARRAAAPPAGSAMADAFARLQVKR